MTNTELSQLNTVLVHEYGHKVLVVFNEMDARLSYINHEYAKHELGWCSIEGVKPYIRPLSSMTESEKDELENAGLVGSLESSRCAAEMLWLLQHHFDVFGLIEKGLAIEKK